MSVLILGATSPIARATAVEYAKRGHAIAVAARDLDEARRIASDLRIRHQIEAKAYRFDAVDVDAHPTLVDEVEEQLGDVAIALVAFGHMGDQEQSQDDFESARRVIDINYSGAVSLCEILASKMEARKTGSILGISSVAGDRGRASNYIYGSAKGAFSLYLQGLRNRLDEHGVHVMTVKLGFVDTRMTFGMDTGIPIASPEQAGQAIANAQERRVQILYYPRFWRGIMTVIQSIPERIFKGLSI